MTPSELKYNVEQHGHDPYFFTRKTMKFFGDTMKNYGVRKGPTVEYHYDEVGDYSNEPIIVETWELYRKHPVKHGLKESSYFDVKSFRRIHL